MKPGLRKHRKYRFPWRQGNRFQLHVDGEAFFPAMLNAIDASREQILLEMYLFQSGRTATRFIDALVDAAERNVQVYILLDDFGAYGLEQSDRKRLDRTDIYLHFFNPLHYGKLRSNLFRDHRKLLIVDGKVAFTGGAGITDNFDVGESPAEYWHDVMVEITGPCCKDWKWLFVDNWNRSNDLKLPFPGSPQSKNQDGQSGRLVFNRSSYLEIRRSFLRQVGLSKSRIWIATAYFAPTWKIRRALKKAAHNGLDVRLLLPGPHIDHSTIRHVGHRFYGQLVRSGVRIFEYTPRFVHAKILMCDDWVSIGSANIERWTQDWNLEANQEINDDTFCQTIVDFFENDFSQSREITEDLWKKRPLLKRIWLEVLRLLDIWIERLKRRL